MNANQVVNLNMAIPYIANVVDNGRAQVANGEVILFLPSNRITSDGSLLTQLADSGNLTYTQILCFNVEGQIYWMPLSTYEQRLATVFAIPVAEFAPKQIYLLNGDVITISTLKETPSLLEVKYEDIDLCAWATRMHVADNVSTPLFACIGKVSSQLWNFWISDAKAFAESAALVAHSENEESEVICGNAS